MKKSLLIILLLIILEIEILPSQFEELDKPPEGAHEGQMLIGASLSLGIPYGDLITAEKDFVKNNTYTFSDSEITKEFLITHLSYDFGISLEYMPIDNVGVKGKLKRVIVVQRTLFGSDFQNWNETLYSNFSFLAGPSLHLTTRKQWVITFTPVLGYGIAKYRAAPVAAKLLSGNTGDRNRDVSGISYGAELSLTLYFSGGLYISVGADWNCYPMSFSPALDLENPESGDRMSLSSGKLNTINLALAAGYAFSN